MPTMARSSRWEEVEHKRHVSTWFRTGLAVKPRSREAVGAAEGLRARTDRNHTRRAVRPNAQ